MNSMQLKDKIRNIANKKNIDFSNVFRLYMYDRFIERLSVSKYKDNFILKGGFYLSALFGIENRATMDIDTAITKAIFNEKHIRKMLEIIVKINLNDNAILKLVKLVTIREEDDYGGYRATISVEIENIRESFQIDIATGDPITPKAIIYKYLPTLGNKHINLWAYNIETVLAEKIETILTRATGSSRIRDYYDIYLIYKMYWDNVNKYHFRKAVENTFKKRKFNKDINETINIIKNSLVLKERWVSYTKKYKYAKDISFDEILKCLESIVSHLYNII
ncbi:MAG TPA: nucleotidyl transferase AbiEii/AbiGii toxin family protein [Bacilli bacterium]|nr:nucleotidyl transferase AbiEii/AbiGii toxin family protein [Bacilli bacterium]